MKGHLLKWAGMIISFVLLSNGCQECVSIDEKAIHIFYKDRAELKHIKNFIREYCLPVDCDASDDCYRYMITIQHIQSDRVDTIVWDLEIPNIGKENNINLITNKTKEKINAFDFTVIESLLTINEDSLKNLYVEKIQDQGMIYAYFSKKNNVFFDDSVKSLYNLKDIRDSITFVLCNNTFNENFCLLWEPILRGQNVPGSEPVEKDRGITELPETVDCNLTPQVTKLESQLSGRQNRTALATLRRLAFNALDCGQAASIISKLIQLETNKLNSFISSYGPEYKGIKAGLEYEDERLINLEIGRLSQTREDVYQVNLLAANDVFINGRETYDLPAFKMYTEKMQITDPLKINLDWPLASGGYETIKGTLRPGSPITKDIEGYNVTLSMNSTDNDPFVKVELYIKKKGIIDTTKVVVIQDGADLSGDKDRDGFIGYFDLNDANDDIYPQLENQTIELGRNIEFRIKNGDNLKNVAYEWYVDGVRNDVKYFQVKKLGFIELKVRLLHIPTNTGKELVAKVHPFLPKSVLENDLQSILRIGQYKSPSQPPTIEKRRADEAEERVYSYFESGCTYVRDQTGQRKSLMELINADLRGGSGTFNGIKIKGDLIYKMDGSGKLCSFTFELQR